MEQVVLLPGLMCDERLFEPLIKLLKPNYHVHVPIMDTQKSIDGMVKYLLNTISGSFHLVGLSMGGIIAMTVAIKDPSRVKSMVLMDTSPHSDSVRKQAARDKQIETVNQPSDLARIVAQELKPNYVHDRSSNEHVLKLCMKMAMDLGCEVFINQCSALRNRKSLIDSLSFIDCKTLVLCGEHDKLCPVTVHEEIEAKIPNAELSIIPNCGHLPILEKPKLSTEKILAFLGEGRNECRI